MRKTDFIAVHPLVNFRIFRPAPAVVKARGDGTAEVIFDEPQRAITPGQSVVWYRDDLVVGGGVISR